MADQGVETSDEGVRIAERHLELAQVRYEAGSAARLDVLRAEVELANARARLIRARSSAEVSYQALRTALSLPPNEPLQLSGTLDDLPTLPSREDLDSRQSRLDQTSARLDSSVKPRSGSCRSQMPISSRPSRSPATCSRQEDGVNRLVRWLEPELPVRIGRACSALQRAGRRGQARSRVRACGRPSTAPMRPSMARLELSSHQRRPSSTPPARLSPHRRKRWNWRVKASGLPKSPTRTA